MSKTYFSDDGNYGDGDAVDVIDTTDWLPDMWVAIEEESDMTRSALARHFDHGVHLYKDEMCVGCGLKPYQLGKETP